MNAYQEMQDRQQKEFNSFPCFFAFGQEQFDEGMKKLGLKPSDTKLIYRAPGGMYYRKTDSNSLKEMMARFDMRLRNFSAGFFSSESSTRDCPPGKR